MSKTLSMETRRSSRYRSLSIRSWTVCNLPIHYYTVNTSRRPTLLDSHHAHRSLCGNNSVFPVKSIGIRNLPVPVKDCDHLRHASFQRDTRPKFGDIAKELVRIINNIMREDITTYFNTRKVQRNKVSKWHAYQLNFSPQQTPCSPVILLPR